MDGIAESESEPALSRAVVQFPLPTSYRPIGKFQMAFRIWRQTFTVATKPYTTSPAHSHLGHQYALCPGR